MLMYSTKIWNRNSIFAVEQAMKLICFIFLCRQKGDVWHN